MLKMLRILVMPLILPSKNINETRNLLITNTQKIAKLEINGPFNIQYIAKIMN